MSQQPIENLTTEKAKKIIFKELKDISTQLEEEEENKMTFRFNHLSIRGKIKLASKLKEKSRLITVHNLSITKIKRTLEKANPIIISNWSSGFCYGQMPSYVEKKLSTIIYKLETKGLEAFKRKSTELMEEILGWNMSDSSLKDESKERIKQKLAVVTPPNALRNAIERQRLTMLEMPEESEPQIQSELIANRNSTSRGTIRCPECGSLDTLIIGRSIQRCDNCGYSESLT